VERGTPETDNSTRGHKEGQNKASRKKAQKAQTKVQSSAFRLLSKQAS